jgi:hypothetical protein
MPGICGLAKKLVAYLMAEGKRKLDCREFRGDLDFASRVGDYTNKA